MCSIQNPYVQKLYNLWYVHGWLLRDYATKMKKFKDLISRQGSGAKDDLSPVSDPGDTPSPPASPHEIVAKTKDEREFPNDPTTEEEVIASIEEYYLRDDTFDSSKYELEKIPDELDNIQLKAIDEDRNRLRRQLQAVSKKMSDVILANQASYSKELGRVTELEECLENARVICRNGRSELHMTMQGFTVASLGIMSKNKKKLQLLNLLKSLHTIKTLEEDYPGAIQLCLECQNAAVTFRHYKCISELSSKLQDTLEMIEEQLDKALAKTCTNFDIIHYDKLQAAYKLLGKTETAMNQLHMHFTSSIHNIAFQIVLGYVQLVTATTDSRFQKMQFKDLCSHVDLETYIPCLVDLCKALWEVMKSYYKTMDWHKRQSAAEEEVPSEEVESDDNMGGAINMLYINQKLERGLARIWQDVQQKVKLFLIATDLSSVKYDDFIYVLDLVNRLIDIGQEFCGSGSEGLHESIRQQSLKYFKNYHNSRMEELRMFMENEGWRICPVKSNFTHLNLHEFRFLRPSISSKENQPLDSPSSPTLGSVRGFLRKFSEKGSPFDKQVVDESKGTGAVNGVSHKKLDVKHMVEFPSLKLSE
ncbi:putative coiled-coil domain-containing protein [Apostichopus japonicus]|uniref:Putative coiled-coil domain-containing protein n=1 Tax=Stichopus japonicus TaxID=307972 RepID=A0A2G8KNH3_STIJA|nr:putative coiled-coil domain-containing protein [Apostichopus japonicus]